MTKQPALIAAFSNGLQVIRKSYTREYTHCWGVIFTPNDAALAAHVYAAGFSTSVDLARSAARPYQRAHSLGVLTVEVVAVVKAEPKAQKAQKAATVEPVAQAQPEPAVATAAKVLQVGSGVVAINLDGEPMEPGAGIVREVFATNSGEVKAVVFWFSLRVSGVWPSDRLMVTADPFDPSRTPKTDGKLAVRQIVERSASGKPKDTRAFTAWTFDTVEDALPFLDHCRQLDAAAGIARHYLLLDNVAADQESGVK